MFGRPVGARHDVELENLVRKPERRAGVGNIHHARDMALHRGGAEDGVGLCAGIAELLEILDRVQTGLGSQPMSTAKPYVEGRLKLAYLGQFHGEIVVRLKEDQPEISEDERLAKVFALTAREAQVLLWLSHGKTNRDIAEILSLSARSVNKHLEQVFHKMGVDNRTSAAVMADRALHGM